MCKNIFYVVMDPDSIDEEGAYGLSSSQPPLNYLTRVQE